MQLVIVRKLLMQGSGAYHNERVDDVISVELEGRSKAPLNNVGLVVWQSAFVLADYLIAHPPFATWRDVSVIELGAGTGQRSSCLMQGRAFDACSWHSAYEEVHCGSCITLQCTCLFLLQCLAFWRSML